MSKGKRHGVKSRRNQAQASRCPFPVNLHGDALNSPSDKMLQTRETLLSLGVQGFFGGQSHGYAVPMWLTLATQSPALPEVKPRTSGLQNHSL